MKVVVRAAFFSLLCACASNCLAIDREAFTFTSFDLSVRIEPEQQRLGVRGKITLRNDSSVTQKVAVLQISSSLDWRSIQAGDKPLQFVAQTFTSDIDHTGALSEALVTLPEPLAPKGVIELSIGYEGVIVRDATRLTRLGAPEASAKSADWDQIGETFTAVRGAGYVAWYPIATEAMDLADATHPSEALGKWKEREALSHMHIKISLNRGDGWSAEMLINESSCAMTYEDVGRAHLQTSDCTYQPLGLVIPTFVIDGYAVQEGPAVTVHFEKGHDAAATTFAEAAKKTLPIISEWFGTPRGKAAVVDLPDAAFAPFESGPLLLTPLTTDTKQAGLSISHLLEHATLSSPRPWIDEGLAHFAQTLYLERESGREAAISYMGLHRAALTTVVQDNKSNVGPSSTSDETTNSLINSTDEQQYRSKSMYVWWMLRDMIGDAALKKAIATYHPDEDKEASYMPGLIQAQTQRDLEWFFDDWVYRNHGLPDFKIDSVFSRKTLPEGYMVTITVSNQGLAGAEVPVTIKFHGGEVTQRLAVRGKSSAVIRVPLSKGPEEVVANDGSVPESDSTNNTFKVAEPAN